jgi:predicted RNA binding protein YcfA (HicA-like mRNA interferase family)
MKLPRDIDGYELAKALSKLGYSIQRQSGSHIRLTTQTGGEHHVTVPAHSPIKSGTLNSILKDVAAHAKMSRDEVIQKLFG